MADARHATHRHDHRHRHRDANDAAPPRAAPDALPDVSTALPAGAVGPLPSTEDRYRRLKGDLARNRPAVDRAHAHSVAIKAEAEALRRHLIETARQVQSLETDKLHLDADIARLSKQEQSLAASFARDRVQVARLLAVIERVQHDAPPALAMRPDDALSAARGAMLVGASLPDVYGRAAALSRRLNALRATRAALLARRQESERNTRQLRDARVQLDHLLAIKAKEAKQADAAFGQLKAKLDVVAAEAADLGTLLQKVAALRAKPAQQAVVVVSPQNRAFEGPASLLQPVAGTLLPYRNGATSAPGITLLAPEGAQVVAPADCEVLFAGPYHKSGQVLILEVTAGYDLVLAGLGRVVVKAGDQVLAGEPLGLMPLGTVSGEHVPQSGQDAELYFELRRNGRAESPLPLLSLDLRKAKRT